MKDERPPTAKEMAQMGELIMQGFKDQQEKEELKRQTSRQKFKEISRKRK